MRNLRRFIAPCMANRYPNRKCKTWANRGDCLTNEKWMKMNCMQECDFCTPRAEKTNCQNRIDNERCEELAVSGECEANPGQTQYDCPRSCQVCHLSVTLPPVTPRVLGNCKNLHHNDTECESWYKRNECYHNPFWMRYNCAKTCNSCGDITTPLVRPGNCDNTHDSDRDCTIWANLGHCTSNPGWMLKNCEKACNSCPGVTKPYTRKTARPGNCDNTHDSDRDCTIWSNLGHCTSNPGWMLKNCEKACNSCPGVTKPYTRKTSRPSTCTNIYNDVSCQEWARSGQCNINPSFMLQNCQKACKSCRTVTSRPTVPRPTVNPPTGCTDIDANCAALSKEGQCKQSAYFMLKKCRKSCQNCANACRDMNKDCQAWADNHDCVKNPEYMMRNCQRACQVCE